MIPLMDFIGIINEDSVSVMPQKPGGSKEKRSRCSATDQLQ